MYQTRPTRQSVFVPLAYSPLATRLPNAFNAAIAPIQIAGTSAFPVSIWVKGYEVLRRH